MEKKGINDNQMTVNAGLSVGLIGKAKVSGKGMSSMNIEKILLAYPDLNSDWLLTGRGEMLKTNCISENISVTIADSSAHKDNKKVASSNEIKDLNTDFRPRIPYDAAAGALSIAEHGISRNDCEMLPVIPRFPKYDFTIVAKGDSMIPEIASGDELACRFIDPKGFIQWGRPHVLDTAQGVVVKNIFELPDSILCRSVNNNYPDFPIAKDDIYHIALVVGLIRQY